MMPVWLKCEIDSNQIILEGTPRIENKDEETVIRVTDTADYIIREFNIIIEEAEEPLENDNSGSVADGPSVSRQITMNLRNKLRNKLKMKLKTMPLKKNGAYSWANKAKTQNNSPNDNSHLSIFSNNLGNTLGN